MREAAIKTINETKIVSILRGIQTENAVDVVEALYAGGIRVVEVTFDTDGAAEIIRKIKSLFADKMLIGAGTVLDSETARTAILSGADFILSPALRTDVIKMCNRYNKLAIPGVLTPTEIVAALEAGASYVKLFPARTFGATYIKDVKSPLKQVSVMAVGGVNLSNICDFIKNGASSVGIGSELYNAKADYGDDFSIITKTAKLFLEKLYKLQDQNNI